MINTFVALDIETTGLNPAEDKIIEVGMAKISDGEIVDSYSTLVNPGIKISERITMITGITDDMVEGKPEITEIISDIVDFTKDMPILGHNVIFDYSFIKKAAVNSGLDFKKTSYGKSSGKYDTTADFLTNIENRNGKFYTDKATIDKIGQVEARGEDFSPLNKRIMSSRASTEGGTSVVYKYSDELGTKYLIHEVTDARGYIIHRDFDAVRISSGQLINKGH